MTTFRLFGAAAVFLSVLTVSAMARPVTHRAESIYCATREAGNPHSRICDYLAWSGWRRRGGWDSSLDDACLRDPGYVPGECGLDPRSRASGGFGAETGLAGAR
jgi:hypothetical protein